MEFQEVQKSFLGIQNLFCFVKLNGENAPCWQKTAEKKTAQHFCTSGIRDSPVLSMQFQCLAFLSHGSADPQAAVTANNEQPGLHLAPHQRKCRACSVIHLSDPVHKETLLVLAESHLTEGMSARAFAQSHSTGHNRSEYQSYCPGYCRSSCNTQCLFLGK